MAYLRIATHPTIFAKPLTPDEAMANLKMLLALPHVRVPSEEDGLWTVYRQVTRDLAVRGILVPAAHLAALLRQHGIARLYTNDADFLKSPVPRRQESFRLRQLREGFHHGLTEAQGVRLARRGRGSGGGEAGLLQLGLVTAAREAALPSNGMPRLRMGGHGFPPGRDRRNRTRCTRVWRRGASAQRVSSRARRYSHPCCAHPYSM